MLREKEMPLQIRFPKKTEQRKKSRLRSNSISSLDNMDPGVDSYSLFDIDEYAIFNHSDDMDIFLKF